MPIFTLSTYATEKRFENSTADATAAKNFAENIEWIVESALKTGALRERGMTKAVVSSAFIGVHQYVVSLA